MDNMFCYQCEQTAGCSGCTGSRGVCGKTADVANLRMCSPARHWAGASHNERPAHEGHLASDDQRPVCHAHQRQFQRRRHRNLHPPRPRRNTPSGPGLRLLPESCGHNDDYDMRKLWSAQGGHPQPQSRSFSSACAAWRVRPPPYVLGYEEDETLSRFFPKALFAVGEDWGMEALLPLVLEVGEKNLACMALLDRANTGNVRQSRADAGAADG